MFLVDVVKYMLKTPRADLSIAWAEYRALKDHLYRVRDEKRTAENYLVSRCVSVECMPYVNITGDDAEHRPQMMAHYCEHFSLRPNDVCMKLDCPFVAMNHAYFEKLKKYNDVRTRCRTFWRDRMTNTK